MRKGRKPQEWNQVKASRARSRATIGSVPSTKTFKPPGRQKAPPIRPEALSGTLTDALTPLPPEREGEGEDAFINISERVSHVPGAPQLTKLEHIQPTVPIRHAGGGINKPRPYNAVGPLFGYSEEVRNHAEFLRRTEGEPAMVAYLMRLSEQRRTITMPTDQPTPTTPDPTTLSMGPIETALREAQQKVRHYRDQLLIDQREEARWSQIATDLSRILSLATGKTSPTMSTPTSPSPTPHHKPREGSRYLATPLALGFLRERGQPVDRKELSQYLVDHGASSMASADQWYYRAKKDGIVIDVDGKVALPEWTNPNAQPPTTTTTKSTNEAQEAQS